MSGAMLHAGWAGSQAVELRGGSHHYPHLIRQDLRSREGEHTPQGHRVRKWPRRDLEQVASLQSAGSDHCVTRSLSMNTAPRPSSSFSLPPHPPLSVSSSSLQRTLEALTARTASLGGSVWNHPGMSQRHKACWELHSDNQHSARRQSYKLPPPPAVGRGLSMLKAQNHS